MLLALQSRSKAKEQRTSSNQKEQRACILNAGFYQDSFLKEDSLKHSPVSS